MNPTAIYLELLADITPLPMLESYVSKLRSLGFDFEVREFPSGDRAYPSRSLDNSGVPE